MKKFIFLVLLMISCRSTVDYRVNLGEVELPLTGVALPGNSITFYVEKKIDINQIREVEIERVIWSYKASSFSRVDYTVKITSRGEAEDVKLYVKCDLPELCSALQSAGYEPAPDYVEEAPTVLSGSVDGTMEISGKEQSPEADRELEKCLEKGVVWLIVKVVADPAEYIQGDKLVLRNVEMEINASKDMRTFWSFSRLLF